MEDLGETGDEVIKVQAKALALTSGHEDVGCCGYRGD